MSIKQHYLKASFLVCTLILLAAAGSKEIVINTLGVHMVKLAIPLQSPLDDLNEASLAPYTRYVHLSTVVPPWNGTDSHNGFLPQDYAQGARPSRLETVAWLRLFDPQVWVIPEPSGGADVHLANVRRLRSWLERET